jgi:hypothetical protein
MSQKKIIYFLRIFGSESSLAKKKYLEKTHKLSHSKKQNMCSFMAALKAIRNKGHNY